MHSVHRWQCAASFWKHDRREVTNKSFQRITIDLVEGCDLQKYFCGPLLGIQSCEAMQRIAQCDGNALPDSILIAQLRFSPKLFGR